MEAKSREEILEIQKRRTSNLLNIMHSSASIEGGKTRFTGLEYFPINSKYQYRLKLQTESRVGKVQVALSNGEIVEALRAGFFEFNLDGKARRLHVYKKKADDREMFLPFKDRTSGDETYESGRYLDIELDPTDGSCVLDFNLSYSPLCMLDKNRFVCPIPPAENWLLDLRIEAGEKKLHA